MSDEIILTLLKSEKIIVPYENIRNVLQVSMLICFYKNKYEAFNFQDSEKYYLGPVEITKSEIESKSIESWIKSEFYLHESITCESIDITRRCFLLNGEIAIAIEAIDLINSEGDVIKLRRADSLYPYGLLLINT